MVRFCETTPLLSYYFTRPSMELEILRVWFSLQALSHTQLKKSLILDRGTIKSLGRTLLLFTFVIYDRHLGMNSIGRLPNNVFSSLKNLQGLYVYIN